MITIYPSWSYSEDILTNDEEYIYKEDKESVQRIFEILKSRNYRCYWTSNDSKLKQELREAILETL